MDYEEPTTVTGTDIQTLLFASRETESALVEAEEGFAVVVPTLLIRDQRVLVKSSEVRELVSRYTKHVDRLFVGRHIMTSEGYTLAALAVNAKISAIVDGRPVKVIE
jgi:hypothetical protein